MTTDRIILNANIGMTNVVNFEDFSKIAIKTLNNIVDVIIPMCGVDALHELVIYAGHKREYANNIFSNDGIHILENIEYINPIQTYISNYIRYIASRVEASAADGTSTAIYLASSLIAFILKDLQNIREEYDDFDVILSSRRIMRNTHRLSHSIISVLEGLKTAMSGLVIHISDIEDRELRDALIYNLAMTTSKRDAILTNFVVKLFLDLPPILYELSNFQKSQVETKENFIVEYPDYDMALNITASNNIVYNRKLGMEYVSEDCDLLICPQLFGVVDALIGFVIQRKEKMLPGTERPLVIVFSGIDDREYAIIENTIGREVVLLRLTVSGTFFIDNPLELKVLQAVSGLCPTIQVTLEDFENSVIEHARCRIHGNDLFIYNITPETDDRPIHPFFSHPGVNEGYDKIRYELEEIITSLRDSHDKKSRSMELDGFLRIYKAMVCRKFPSLIIGGSTVDLLSNINVVNDVIGVVSVAMKHGVVLDSMPKMNYVLSELFADSLNSGEKSNWYSKFQESVYQYCRLTYRRDSVCKSLSETVFEINSVDHVKQLQKYMFDSGEGEWVKLDEEHTPVMVVQSYKAIMEMLNRLIETIPKITRIDKIVVQGSVMDDSIYIST